jgi:hypothetical protein
MGTQYVAGAVGDFKITAGALRVAMAAAGGGGSVKLG